MDYKKYSSRYRFRILNFICCLCVLSFIVSGCVPLRKKFTRKKKGDAEQSQKFIPVLEPIDYEEKVYSSQERYKLHYSLWKVWNRDLLQSIERNDSDKRQKYILNQAIERLEEMGKWLTGAQQAELSGLVDDLRGVQEIYAKPASMRNKFSTRKRIELNAKKIRNRFVPQDTLSYRE